MTALLRYEAAPLATTTTQDITSTNQKLPNNRKRKHRAISPERLTGYLYDGRELVGVLKPRGKRRTEAVAVVAGRRKSLGTFASRTAAVAALNCGPTDGASGVKPQRRRRGRLRKNGGADGDVAARAPSVR